MISFEAAKRLKENLAKNGEIELVPIDENLVDSVWTAINGNQPAFEPKQIDHLPIEFSGKCSADKISELRSFLKEQNYSSIVLSALDEIACKRRKEYGLIFNIHILIFVYVYNSLSIFFCLNNLKFKRAVQFEGRRY